MRLLACISVAAALTLPACQDSTITSVGTPDSGILRPAQPPTASGIVVRDERFAFFLTIDSKRGLTSIQGIDIVEACMGNPIFESAPIQEIHTPTGAIIELLKGENLTTSVWPFAGFSCFLFTTTDPLAVGKSSVIRNDNDILLSGTRTNSFGWRGHGILYDGVGAAIRFHNNVRLLILKNGEFKMVVSDIFLQ